MGVDLAVFEAFGARGRAVVTVETDQGPDGVRSLGARDPSLVAEELENVLLDLDPAAVKIGALGTRAIAEAVARTLDDGNIRPVVFDPVLAASAGGHLLEPDAVPHLADILGPVVDVLTPNIPEAEALLGDQRAHWEAEAADLDLGGPAGRLAAALCKQRWETVLVKGGHAEGDELWDLLAEDGGLSSFQRPRLEGPEIRGTGCALSAAIAGFLSQGASPWTACNRAGLWVHQLIAEAHAAGRQTLDPAAVPLPSREPKE